jgi:Carbohydrate-binding module 48 (Isoamylase N-terminal domain)
MSLTVTERPRAPIIGLSLRACAIRLSRCRHGFSSTVFDLNVLCTRRPQRVRGRSRSLRSAAIAANGSGLEHVGQILSDGHVMFRLLAPNAQSVSVVVVINSGELTTQMTQELFGLWTATLGPFKPDLYEYSFILDGVRIADPGNATPKPQWQVNTSLLLVPGTPLISWTHKMSRMELFAKRPTTRLRLANIAGCWSIPRPIMTVLLTPPFLSFTFTMAAGIRATRG